MVSRRPLLIAASAACIGLPGAARAQQRRSLADPLRLGVDTALAESGLAHALQQGFGRDTGVAVAPRAMPALPLLEALERGEFDAALANAEPAEAALDRQGLVHDRRAVARGDFVIVGPAPRGHQPDPAGVAGMTDAAAALARIRDAGQAGAALFVSAGDGSGTHAAEQAAWRAARIAPAPPWYVSAGATAAAIAEARARGAYALIERGAWLARGGAPLAALVQGDALVAEPVHVLRPFRTDHPAGKLFVAWVAGPKGRRLVAALRGYRAP
jgi:tungstate transport system substrate-binding protein